MTQTKNNKVSSQTKLRITLDTSKPVKDERPIARLYGLFSQFNKQYSKGAVRK